ncbi:glycyl-tRNA synthetase [Cryptosporidium ubiquitum]|uniref:glycine--tRNA ligase n=1 Tax=Cryptosporidium ubiquitum TaxID=857276 RepID=A0A1J4MED4_9CRYT|nr:glycyl-tRNA synthetase [Cryptosporidium ubiquitum]OII72590.1 glycyl-tRNA synthetase [Cryptosporidium ubiquitum]
MDQKTLVERREVLDNLLKRRFFIAPSFEIYGGVAGLFDYGPPGCALKSEIESFWRRHFVLAEDMLEISATCLTPYNPLKASGHVDRFTDLMITDTKTNDCYRADKVLEEYVENRLKEKSSNPPKSEHEKNDLESLGIKAGSLGVDEIKEVFNRYQIKPPSGGEWSEPYPFNLMFRTKIGPKEVEGRNDNVGFMRPETAQGIFVNFKRLFDYNGKKLPFSVAQIGLGFRNEIAPRNGLLRVREFQMAEIEHFVHPDRKNHHKFNDVASKCLPLYSRRTQLKNGEIERNITLREAVHGEEKIIDNETLAYFLSRTYDFLISIGINPLGIRFRQHLSTEMAHYASDCWDAEVLTSYGWIECAGHADRSCYDLLQHSKSAKTDLLASEKYDEPQFKNVLVLTLNKPLIGKTFKQEASLVTEALQEFANKGDISFQEKLNQYNKAILNYKSCENKKEYQWEISSEMAKFEFQTKKVTEEQFTPAVIEPSFGIGRILYCLLEHSFKIREDLSEVQDKDIGNKINNSADNEMQRSYLSLPALIAPIKCSILPISSNIIFDNLISLLHKNLINHGISCKVDTSSASIGRRYARTDEIGIPFGITIDFQSLKDDTVTLRERDSMKQVRIPSAEVASLISKMITQQINWNNVLDNYPLFTQQSSE